VTLGPLDQALSFWKPLIDGWDPQALSCYRAPDQPLVPGINVLRSASAASAYRVREGDSEYSIFAAVHPLADVPESAVILAEIRDSAGLPYSYVLWYPAERCAVMPFDPNEAITALRFERYVPASRRTVLPTPLLSAYYSVKPLLPKAVKFKLRQAMARRTLTSEQFLEWPSDRSLDLLLRLILQVMLLAAGRESIQFLWFWPHRHPWAAILTHDVETAEGLRNVPHVMELECRRGLRSSFNLVVHDYEKQGSLLDRLRDEGFEIGVHGYKHDGLMFTSWPRFVDRAVAINECARQWGAVGFRSPATYRNPEWMHLLAFEYDSSLTDTAPFEPQPGGCGSQFPFFLGDLLELPMTLPQDHTLFSLLGHTDSGVWLTKLAEIRDANGMACMLTHPDPGHGYIGREENEQRYDEALALIEASEAWTPLPRDLARWWMARASVESVRDRPDGASLAVASIDPAHRLTITPPEA